MADTLQSKENTETERLGIRGVKNINFKNGERYILSFVFDRSYTEVRVFLNAVNSRVFF